MPTNNQTDACISTEGESLVFWAPGPQPRRHSSRVQIIDVFSLQVARVTAAIRRWQGGR
jgi:hypothetical protein